MPPGLRKVLEDQGSKTCSTHSANALTTAMIRYMPTRSPVLPKAILREYLITGTSPGSIHTQRMIQLCLIIWTTGKVGIVAPGAISDSRVNQARVHTISWSMPLPTGAGRFVSIETAIGRENKGA